jgi:hypothetical protein
MTDSLIPEWFLEMIPYIQRKPTYDTLSYENRERIYEEMALDGWGEMHLKEIRRFWNQRTPRKEKYQVSYSTWLNWHYKIKLTLQRSEQNEQIQV